MPTIQHHDAQATATLSAAERDWIRRQGRAARSLEARQRQALRARRFAPKGLPADRTRRFSPPRP
jgi:hypothetical protein